MWLLGALRSFRAATTLNEDRRIASIRLNRPIRAWCPVSSKQRVAEHTYWLEFEAPEIAERAIPGQFMMIGFGASGFAVPFLPRPNSIAAASDGQVGLLIRVFGEGSKKLSTLRPGDTALLLGPLGIGFDLQNARKIICLAGGVGLAPFILLPAWARHAQPEAEIRLLYGERNGAAAFDQAKLAELSGIEAELFTEDGSLGKHGKVTDSLNLQGVHLVLACGPTPMLKAVRKLTLAAGVRCQVAVEENMACGMGTCIGCVIPTLDPATEAEGYSRACIDGPVFPVERLRW